MSDAPPPLDRRHFLQTLGALGLARLGVGTAIPRHAERLARIGIQLYTVRRELARDFEGTLAALARIGYTEVEFAGYHGHSPAAVRATLERLGLAAPSAHVGSAATLTKSWERTLETARAIGHRYVICPWIDANERATLDDYRRIAERFDRAGELARNYGLRFGYHNHDFELAPIAGTIPYDILLERTDPALVCFEMDLYWLTRGGQRPLDYFARWPGRFPLVHAKDMDASRERRMVDVGAGAIDFAAILARRREAGITHVFVEHDEPRPDGLASARASYAYLSRLEF